MANRLLGPRCETSPVVFGVFPDNLDQIQLWAIGRQMEQHRTMLDEPAIERFLIDVMMNLGVV